MFGTSGVGGRGTGKKGQEGKYGAKKWVHMHVNAKMIPVETILRIEVRRIKES
jgi:hypothetical protein